jgi:hypothetical protein
MMNMFTMGISNQMLGDDELTTALDSMQAGSVDQGPRPTAAVTGLPVGAPIQQGPPARGGIGPIPGPGPAQREAEMAGRMPEAYTQNRMEQWGMPGIFQMGEAIADKYRANRWTENQGMQALEQVGIQDDNAPGTPVGNPAPIQVDEVQMLNAGGNPQVAYDTASGGSGSARAGETIGNIGRKVFDLWSGGMFG